LGIVSVVRGHPPFLLSRKGEETEEEREKRSMRSRRRRHHLTNPLPIRPPDVTGAGSSKHQHASISEPKREWHERPRSSVAGRVGSPVSDRTSGREGGVAGPQRDGSEAYTVSTRPPARRGAHTVVANIAGQPLRLALRRAEQRPVLTCLPVRAFRRVTSGPAADTRVPLSHISEGGGAEAVAGGVEVEV
jgi:hypothetical protein